MFAHLGTCRQCKEAPEQLRQAQSKNHVGHHETKRQKAPKRCQVRTKNTKKEPAKKKVSKHKKKKFQNTKKKTAKQQKWNNPPKTQKQAPKKKKKNFIWSHLPPFHRAPPNYDPPRPRHMAQTAPTHGDAEHGGEAALEDGLRHGEM